MLARDIEKLSTAKVLSKASKPALGFIQPSI
jgi:hypothetical protein